MLRKPTFLAEHCCADVTAPQPNTPVGYTRFSFINSCTQDDEVM